MGVLKDLGLDNVPWQYQVPVGIFLAIPIIENKVLMLSEEMQLVGCFAMFCGVAPRLPELADMGSSAMAMAR